MAIRTCVQEGVCVSTNHNVHPFYTLGYVIVDLTER